MLAESAARFWPKVNIGEPDACWLWMAAKSGTGGPSSGRDPSSSPAPMTRRELSLSGSSAIVEGDVPEDFPVKRPSDLFVLRNNVVVRDGPQAATFKGG